MGSCVWPVVNAIHACPELEYRLLRALKSAKAGDTTELDQIQAGFDAKSSGMLPGCIGALDGCAEAIRVPRVRGNGLGGWSQNGRTCELHYMGPSVLPSPEAYELLGWLLDGSYQALPPSWKRRRGAADTAEPGEPTS